MGIDDSDERNGEPLPYNMNTHSSAQEIIRLYGNVSLKATKYLDQISSTDVNDVLVGLERPATRAEILMEMLEHSIHHRGQLIVYFRLLDIEPVKISYIYVIQLRVLLIEQYQLHKLYLAS